MYLMLYRLFMIGMALAIGIALWLAMEKTRMGAAVDDALARGVGIDTNRISMFIQEGHHHCRQLYKASFETVRSGMGLVPQGRQERRDQHAKMLSGGERKCPRSVARWHCACLDATRKQLYRT